MTWPNSDLDGGNGIIFLLTRPLRDVTCHFFATPLLIPFLLTRPLRDVTLICLYLVLTNAFLLTRPLRDVTNLPPQKQQLTAISTHTPLTGRDILSRTHINALSNFYSHAPYGTWPDQESDCSRSQISTHTPLTGRDILSSRHHTQLVISTHTPLTGRDWGRKADTTIGKRFLLTRPLRDVTNICCHS